MWLLYQRDTRLNIGNKNHIEKSNEKLKKSRIRK